MATKHHHHHRDRHNPQIRKKETKLKKFWKSYGKYFTLLFALGAIACILLPVANYYKYNEDGVSSLVCEIRGVEAVFGGGEFRYLESYAVTEYTFSALLPYIFVLLGGLLPILIRSKWTDAIAICLCLASVVMFIVMPSLISYTFPAGGFINQDKCLFGIGAIFSSVLSMLAAFSTAYKSNFKF